jgi:hypothetical protein
MMMNGQNQNDPKRNINPNPIQQTNTPGNVNAINPNQNPGNNSNNNNRKNSQGSYTNQNNFNEEKEEKKREGQNGKYTCRFEIQIENDKEFQVARRLIGAKVYFC